MREVYWIGDRFIVEWEDGRVEEFEVEKIEELKKELNLRDRIEFELSMIEREVEKEELGEDYSYFEIHIAIAYYKSQQ